MQFGSITRVIGYQLHEAKYLFAYSRFAYSHFAYSRFAYFRPKSGVLAPTHKYLGVKVMSNYILKQTCLENVFGHVKVTSSVCSSSGIVRGMIDSD